MFTELVKKIQVGWEEVAHRQVKGCINCALPSMFSYFTFILVISMEQKTDNCIFI